MGEIFTIMIDMPCWAKGHVNCNKDGTYTIFINAKLGVEEQRETYIHEIKHIKCNDFDKYDVSEIEHIAHHERSKHENSNIYKSFNSRTSRGGIFDWRTN